MSRHIQHAEIVEGPAAAVEALRDDHVEARDIVYPTSVKGIFAVPSGLPRIAAPELIASRRMKLLLDTLFQGMGNGVVIVDSGFASRRVPE